MNEVHEAAQIHAVEITKVYGTGPRKVEVFRDLSLVVRHGERLAVVGASGVGKSTLLHILGALDTPSSGKVLFGGHDVFQWSEQELARFRNEHIGFVFQFHYLMPEFSALENVMMPGLIAGLPKREMKERAMAFLDRLHMAHRSDHRPSELSGGEQQRVAIARALIRNPDILLADEPTGNLDTRTARTIQRLLVRLNEEMKLTMVVVTHNQELAALMDRTLVMEEGTLRETPRGVTQWEETRP